MRRLLLSCTMLAASAALAPACARGASSSTDELASEPAHGDGGAGPGACPTPCGEGTVCSAGVCVASTVDADHDGFPVSVDCDDHDPKIHPGATEICNGKDDNCNGQIDEGFDVDGDGYFQCESQGKKVDCDDHDPAVHPDAIEVCNNKDDNCDGRIDEGFDVDNDGYYQCPHATIPLDCDDHDPAVHPFAKEICDGKDNDCDGLVDDIPALLAGPVSLPPDPHWVLAGNALLSGGWAELTADAANQAGALWWNAGYTFDTFDVTGTFWLQAKPVGADGVAFAWVPGASTSAVGSGGPSYGLGGLGGYGVVVDTYQNPGEPAAPFLALVDGTTSAHLLRAALPDVRNSAGHTLRVKLDGGKVSAWVDGVSYFFDFPIPGYVPFAGHWGFTAGTGAVSTQQQVQSITMSFPKGQGCVP